MTTFTDIDKQLKSASDPQKADVYRWFFKTGKGQYGEGDVFIGVTVPKIRAIVRKNYINIPLSEVAQLITHKVHEYRMCGLLILTEKAARADETDLNAIVDLYVSHTKYVNNWDLVDCSAHKILGRYLADQPEKRIMLDRLANSALLWDQRIAIITTYWFIKQDDFSDTLRIAERLLGHEHDLIHKAVGWMLREVGNRDRKVEEDFLLQHYKTMPRTMLRYAIEKFNPERRKAYLNGSA